MWSKDTSHFSLREEHILRISAKKEYIKRKFRPANEAEAGELGKLHNENTENLISFT